VSSEIIFLISIRKVLPTSGQTVDLTTKNFLFGTKRPTAPGDWVPRRASGPPLPGPGCCPRPVSTHMQPGTTAHPHPDPPHARAPAAADWAAAPQAGGAHDTVEQSTVGVRTNPERTGGGSRVVSLAGGASLSPPEQPNRCSVLPRRTVGGAVEEAGACVK